MDARNFDFSDEAPEIKDGGWCYDLSKVVPNQHYTVAVCMPVTSTRFTLSSATYCGAFGWICLADNARRVSGTVYAFREIPALPEPPPLPEGWGKEENGG